MMRKLRIDLTDLELIFESSEPELRSFLNLDNGQIVTPGLPNENDETEDVEDYEDNDQYAEIPMQGSQQGYRDMEAFVEGLADNGLAEKLAIAIQGKGAFRRFKDVLVRYPDVEKHWFEFKSQRLQERIAEWLEEIDVELDTAR